MSAQAESAQATHNCQSIINNFKSSQHDYQSLIDAGTPWNDPSFPNNQDTLYWTDYNNGKGPFFDGYFLNSYAYQRGCSWKGTSIMGDNQTFYGDINQHRLGTCYFLSSLSAIGEYPN